jgi:hypothetical protein
MGTSAKSLSLANQLHDSLKLRFSLVNDVAFDTDGNPFFRVSQGTVAAGQQAACVKVAPIMPLGVDVIGNAARGYAPDVVQIVLEASATSGQALASAANVLLLQGEAVKSGCRVELYLSANGNSVGPEDITSGNLKATWDADLQYKTMLSQ